MKNTRKHKQNNGRKNVFVAVSGGVDSAVAAALLKEQGYDITAVFMKNWSGDDLGIEDDCPWKEDQEIAMKVADHLDIPFKSYNFEKEYREKVITNFFEEYERGNTPNPDILCNSFIKFDSFLEKALSEGADMIATGHYARTEAGSLLKAEDQDKDQTYFLSGLSKSQLKPVLFPLGDYKKTEVRELAKNFNLPNADRKDSQGICFVGKVDIEDFLKQRLKEKEGEIKDIETGEVVGKHNGVWFYTHGQRKGLGIGGLDIPYFIAKKDPNNNILYVAKGKSNDYLWREEIHTDNLHTIDPNLKTAVTDLDNLKGQIRYRSPLYEISSVVQVEENHYRFNFVKPQWAPAPGQSVVFYKDNECLGRAVIVS